MKLLDEQFWDEVHQEFQEAEADAFIMWAQLWPDLEYEGAAECEGAAEWFNHDVANT